MEITKLEAGVLADILQKYVYMRENESNEDSDTMETAKIEGLSKFDAKLIIKEYIDEVIDNIGEQEFLKEDAIELGKKFGKKIIENDLYIDTENTMTLIKVKELMGKKVSKFDFFELPDPYFDYIFEEGDVILYKDGFEIYGDEKSEKYNFGRGLTGMGFKRLFVRKEFFEIKEGDENYKNIKDYIRYTLIQRFESKVTIDFSNIVDRLNVGLEEQKINTLHNLDLYEGQIFGDINGQNLIKTGITLELQSILDNNIDLNNGFENTNIELTEGFNATVEDLIRVVNELKIKLSKMGRGQIYFDMDRDTIKLRISK